MTAFTNVWLFKLILTYIETFISHVYSCDKARVGGSSHELYSVIYVRALAADESSRLVSLLTVTAASFVFP